MTRVWSELRRASLQKNMHATREAALWSRIDRGVGPDACWVWPGAHNRRGYGHMTFRGKTIATQYIAFEEANGPVPAGMCVMHTCDNPPCCNPAHLKLGTVLDNNADKVAKLRHCYGANHNKARFTEQQVLEIRRRADAGETRAALAREFGVGYGAIDAIAKRRTWKRLPEADPLIHNTNTTKKETTA